VLFFFSDPTDSRIKRYAVDPGGNSRFMPERRNGTPHLDGNFLEQVILVHSRIAIGPHYFKDKRLMLTEPLIENVNLFSKCHFPYALFC
jgi:hypothetical protein